MIHDDVPPELTAELTGHTPVLRRLGDGVDLGLPGPVWVLAVPLRSGDRWVAALTACWPGPEGDDGPQVDLASVAGFAEQLALSLDVAEAQSDRARLAVLEERERIARDLHDMVIQRLFAIGLDVQGAAQDAVRPDVTARLESAVDDLDETIKDVRTTIFRLGARAGGGASGLRHLIDSEVVRSRQALGFLPRLRIEGVTGRCPTTSLPTRSPSCVRRCRTRPARACPRGRGAGARRCRAAGRGAGRRRRASSRTSRCAADWRTSSSGLRHRGGAMSVERLGEGGTLLSWTVPLHGG